MRLTRIGPQGDGTEPEGKKGPENREKGPGRAAYWLDMQLPHSLQPP